MLRIKISYNRKSRLEFWIVYFDEGEQKPNIRRLHPEVSISNEDFLKSVSSFKSLEDVKLQDANAVFGAFKTVLGECNMELEILIYTTTDNCTKMNGKLSGFVTGVKEICTKAVDFPGFSSLKANLLQKSEIKPNSAFGNLVKLVESFSPLLTRLQKHSLF